MAKDRDTPIIIKKKKVSGHGHHGGAWKVAFADFMTAMFAMFLVLWLVNQSSEVKDSIANYFRDPVGWEHGGFRSIVTRAGGGQGSAPKKVQRSQDIPKLSVTRAARQAAMAGAAQEIKQQLEATKKLRDVSRNVSLDMVPAGLRISLTEDPNVTFFQSGKADLADQAVDVLGVIGTELSHLPNHVMIEGHTDGRQYSPGAQYTNWELSADRANQARRIMIAAGMPEANVVEVRGFADRDLLVKEDPLSPRNRRITITVLYDEPPDEPAAEGADGGEPPAGAEGATPEKAPGPEKAARRPHGEE